MFKFRDVILLFMELVYWNSLKFIPKAVRQDPAIQLNLPMNLKNKGLGLTSSDSALFSNK